MLKLFAALLFTACAAAAQIPQTMLERTTGTWQGSGTYASKLTFNVMLKSVSDKNGCTWHYLLVLANGKKDEGDITFSRAHKGDFYAAEAKLPVATQGARDYGRMSAETDVRASSNTISGEFELDTSNAMTSYDFAAIYNPSAQKLSVSGTMLVPFTAVLTKQPEKPVPPKKVYPKVLMRNPDFPQDDN